MRHFGKTQKRILAFMQEGPPRCEPQGRYTTETIAARLELPVHTVRNALGRLWQHGYVYKANPAATNQKQIWTLSDKGWSVPVTEPVRVDPTVDSSDAGERPQVRPPTLVPPVSSN